MSFSFHSALDLEKIDFGSFRFMVDLKLADLKAMRKKDQSKYSVVAKDTFPLEL